MSSQVAVERIAEVEKRSAGLRKELGLVDLVLMQILYVVGSSWVGTAAKLGTSHTVFWLLAIASFYLPQAAYIDTSQPAINVSKGTPATSVRFRMPTSDAPASLCVNVRTLPFE